MKLERLEAVNGRWYIDADNPDAEPCVSVTTILSVWPKGEAFARWLGNADSYEAAIQHRDEAGERGTIVHGYVETLLAGGTVTVNRVESPDIYKMVQGFVNWYRETAIDKTLVHSEVRLVHNDYHYAGTCDIIFFDGLYWWAVDVKTSKAAYTNYHAQTAAYAEAWESMGNLAIDKRGILLLKTNTKKGFQLVESDCDQKTDFGAFLAAKEIWHRENGYLPQYAERLDGPENVELSLTEV